MMKISIVVSILIAIVLNYSCSVECPDDISHRFTQADYSWIYYDEGDEVYFRDIETEEMYFLNCTERAYNLRHIFYPETRCEEGGYLDEADELDIKLLSNIPYFDTDTCRILISWSTKGTDETIVMMHFRSDDRPYYYPDSSQYGFRFIFDNSTEEFRSPTGGYFSSTKVKYVKESLIGGVNYKEVYSLYYDDPQSEFYDTLFFNKEGILRLVSSKHNIVLEKIN